MNSINILLSIILITLIIVIWWWYMMVRKPDIKKNMFNNIKFKTGDIILFHSYKNLIPMYIGSYWSHIGIVYKDPDNNKSRPLLFEATRTSRMGYCSEYNKNGIIISDLQHRVERYPGMVSCKILNKPIRKSIIRGFNEFILYCKKNMVYNEKVFDNAFKKKIGGRFNHKTNCGELVLLSLVKLGILQQNILKKKIANHLIYVTYIKQVHDNYYHEPIELSIDRFC